MPFDTSPGADPAGRPRSVLRMHVMLVHVPKKGSRTPSMKTAPGVPSGSEKSRPRPAPAAAAVAAYSANSGRTPATPTPPTTLPPR